MNIKTTIQQQYQIDIDTTNLLKLYKIDDSNISEQELREKFSKTRERWQKSANGTFEVAAKRDSAYLQNADKYEQILLNKKYFNALVSYYKKSKPNNEATAFAKSFFQFIKENNKTISKSDIKFFFMYFTEQQKNQKAINEMLYNDFKILGLKKSNDENADNSNTKEKKASRIAQNRFQKETLRILHSCELKYAVVQSSEYLKSKEPKLAYSMYDFLRVDGLGLSELKRMIEKRSAEAYEQRQNNSRGNEFIPLTEFYNSVKDMLSQSDVTEENFYHFKLLIRYPHFTPYMYLLESVNKNCVSKFVNEIGKSYEFAGEEEFLAVYLKPLIDSNHFSCDADRQLTSKMRQIAQNPAELERARQKKFAAIHRRKSVPITVRILRFFATWPVCLLHFVFEIFNFSIRSIKRSSFAYYIPLFIPILLFTTHITHGMSFFEWIANIFNIVPETADSIVDSLSATASLTVFSQVITYILAIAGCIISIAIVPTIITTFLYCLACAIDQGIDLVGINMTFTSIQNTIDTKITQAYKEDKKKVYLSMIWPIFANILVVVACVASVFLIRMLIIGAATPVTV